MHASRTTYAIIGWGSLIWNPASLPHDGRWRPGGPTLPIEFTRISPDGRLTLIVDRDHGVPVISRWSVSPRTSVGQAVTDLARRERCDARWIGYIDRGTGERSRVSNPAQTDVDAALRRWIDAVGVAGAVWTALPGTFADRAGEPFSVANALSYLDRLSGDLRQVALTYLRHAPREVDTPVRRAFDDDPRFRP